MFDLDVIKTKKGWVGSEIVGTIVNKQRSISRATIWQSSTLFTRGSYLRKLGITSLEQLLELHISQLQLSTIFYNST